MTIHHSQLKKAERMGVTLTEYTRNGAMGVSAHWPKKNWRISGANAGHALSGMAALQKIDEANANTFIHSVDETGTKIILGVIAVVEDVANTNWLVHEEYLSPTESYSALVNLMDGGSELIEIDREQGDEDPNESERPDEPRMPNGVPVNGGMAFREGVPNDANPFDEGSEEAEEWYEDWDEAYTADEAESEKGGSVVNEKYRAKYAELGHPTHCGDWLAVLLNNLVGTGERTNLELFETICSMNNVSLAKYKRTGTGWQGRLRMTGRNLLARKIWEAGGAFAVPPICNAQGYFQAPSDWMMSQKYAKNGVQGAAAAPAPTGPATA